jgi:hypothetical protein
MGVHKVQITDVHCTRTYGEVLEYSDVGIVNRKLIRRARERMKPLWGQISVVLLDPFAEGSQLLVTFTERMRTNHLPGWLVYAWLRSDWCRDQDSYGTHLVVGFFAREVFLEPISQVISRRASRLSWEDFSVDYHL